jgi:hypothetical protein
MNADKPVLDSSYPDGDGYWNVHTIDISQERVDETVKDRHEFEEMVKKGTKAWADTPDDWVDDLRDGVEKIVPSDYTNSHQPVAWMWKDGTLTSDPDFADGTWTPLFAAPPKPEWVGLTEEERAKCWTTSAVQTAINIEAKLKEKNYGQ